MEGNLMFFLFHKPFKAINNDISGDFPSYTGFE